VGTSTLPFDQFLPQTHAQKYLLHLNSFPLKSAIVVVFLDLSVAFMHSIQNLKQLLAPASIYP
jgi:hypothetical protein